MHKLSAALTLASALLTSNCAFAAESYRTELAFIAANKTAILEQSQIAKGDLNGDGLEDAAIMLVTEASPAPKQQLVVLLNSASGLKVAVASTPEPRVGMGCCWVDSLAIKNASIYIQNNAKTACTMEAATHQFKFYRSVWRLIGLKIELHEHCDDSQKSITRDFNLLTGKSIITETGKAPTTSKRGTAQLPVSLLKDFDFNNGFGVP